MRSGVVAALLATACCWVSVAAAGPVEDRFESANRAYEEGRYDAAEAEYRAIIAYGLHAPEIYYNLGNACFRQGHLGQAILNYERALKLEPGNEDARFNLEYCRQLIADRDALPKHWIVDAYEAWTRRMGADGESWLLLCVYFPAMAALGGWIALRDPQRRRLARFAAITLLVLLVPAGGLVVVRAAVEGAKSGAVVLEQKVEGRSGPGEGHAVLFTVHEGLSVQVRNESEGWLQVLLPNGLNGWVPATSVERL